MEAVSRQGAAELETRLLWDAAPGKSGLHARGEGERVLALESREGSYILLLPGRER